MTLEFNTTDYVVLMSGLIARSEKVQGLIEIFGQDDKSPNVLKYYREELLDIQSMEERLIKAFQSPVSIL
jgi:hypothetical protein